MGGEDTLGPGEGGGVGESTRTRGNEISKDQSPGGGECNENNAGPKGVKLQPRVNKLAPAIKHQPVPSFAILPLNSVCSPQLSDNGPADGAQCSFCYIVIYMWF